jgi:hypothetical protein
LNTALGEIGRVTIGEARAIVQRQRRRCLARKSGLRKLNDVDDDSGSAQERPEGPPKRGGQALL